MPETEHWDIGMAQVNAPHQFSHENGIDVTWVEPGLARGVLVGGPNSLNPHGMIHGGALATLADTVGGCCACCADISGLAGRRARVNMAPEPRRR